jgi:hypothetical protein
MIAWSIAWPMPEATRLMAYSRNAGICRTAARSLGWPDFAGPRTIRNVPSDLSRVEVKEEGNLLIEAVALLVQRQRESEGWIAEQIWQAEERAAAAERRYAELEVRLVGIEENLARLTHEVEPAPGDAVVEERLARLREQVEGLKSGGDGRTGRPTAVPDRPPEPAPVAEAPAPEPVVERSGRAPEPVVERPSRAPESVGARPSRAPEPHFERPPVAADVRQSAAADERPAAGPPPRVAVTPQGSSFWELFGASPADRAGLGLIGGGLVFVVYALLTQLHFS